LNRLTRKVHYWLGAIIALPLLVVVASGILLQLKKQLTWVQPPEQKPPVKALAIGPEHMLQALQLADHINNDGLHLYFSNLGLHQAAALEGLKAMKLTATAALFLKAAKLVGPRGANKSMAVREAAIDALPESAQKAIFKIEDQFDKHCQLIFKAVDRMITQKPDLFRPVRK
jgi:hypothetical protein